MTEKNITTTSELVPDIITKFIFGQKHHGIDCALCPTAKRACDRAWFTESQIKKWSRMSETTLWRRLEKLEKVSRICSSTDSIECDIPTNDGDFQVDQFYNLNVLNQLAMVCVDNENLNDISCKFSDIMSEVETTGGYSIRKPQQQSMMCLPQDYEYALEALLTEVRKNKALQEELDETKALLAEERKYFAMLNEAVDEFVRTNARGNGEKVASDLGTAGAESKEYEDWMTTRDWCNKHGLPVSIDKPKWTVLARLYNICASYPDREQWHRNASGSPVFPKWACDILDKEYDEDSTFLLENRTE